MYQEMYIFSMDKIKRDRPNRLGRGGGGGNGPIDVGNFDKEIKESLFS